MYLLYTNNLNQTIKLYLNPAGIIMQNITPEFVHMQFKTTQVETKLKDFTWGLSFSVDRIQNYPELVEFLKNVKAGMFVSQAQPKADKKPQPPKPKKGSDQASLEF